MTDPSPREVVAQWVAAYNRHDAAAAAALYHDDATNFQAPWGTTVRGRPAILATFTRVFATFPDIHLEAENLFAAGSSVALEWSFSGTMRGEFAGHPPTGRRFSLRGCETFQVDGTRILVQRGYWDRATMLAQLGI